MDSAILPVDGDSIIEDGYIKVPEAPGLGVELNEDVAREYARPGEPFFGK